MLLMLILACSGDPEPTPEPSCPGDDGDAVVLLVQPYLQSVGPTEAWVYWETDAGVGSRLDWGATGHLPKRERRYIPHRWSQK